MLQLVLGERAIAAITVCMLSSVVLLGSSASPPVVDVSSVQSLESGMLVRVLGVLVDIRVYGSGAEGLTVADIENGDVVRAISSVGKTPQPSSYAHIGDELSVLGEIGQTDSGAVIFSTSDNLKVNRRSELVLTLEAVSRNWILFEGDTIRVKGVLRPVDSGLGLRLCDCSGPFSLAIARDTIEVDRYAGSTVTMTAELSFDYVFGVLTLTPKYLVVE